MTDIMQNWKNKRFAVAESYLVDGSGQLVILTEIGFWAENYEILKQWCDEHSCQAKGMTVEIPDDATLTLFCLRWS